MTTAHIIRSVEGAVRLARLDREGMAFFDVSFDGFWRSFLGPALAFPIYLLIVSAPLEGSEALVPASIAYALGIVATPVVLLLLARLFGVGDRYVPTVVALNWAVLVQAVWFAIVVGLALLAPDDARSGLLAAATLLALLYQGFVTATALGIGGMTATGFVIVDVLVGEIIHGLVGSVF